MTRCSKEQGSVGKLHPARPGKVLRRPFVVASGARLALSVSIVYFPLGLSMGMECSQTVAPRTL
ncbi:uncharacterized protein SCHCODRAFT_02608741 [Schizophyllum commune H4-8]|uniref:uncharacterized protein n=1 Tax=Schizophyllum commune (strain H4-8 / FGSC 9210) TaxID=578458 RepID=UPI00215DF96A|nr:uncharacterized protein SCHCODRAFT_02608741 [Schizophyllum commune H4-8]KAI5900769.1 hypothetical protein SCHCODRAFT_02608741 [Schizophyllum commune H4-8]